MNELQNIRVLFNYIYDLTMEARKLIEYLRTFEVYVDKEHACEYIAYHNTNYMEDLCDYTDALYTAQEELSEHPVLYNYLLLKPIFGEDTHSILSDFDLHYLSGYCKAESLNIFKKTYQNIDNLEPLSLPSKDSILLISAYKRECSELIHDMLTIYTGCEYAKKGIKEFTDKKYLPALLNKQEWSSSEDPDNIKIILERVQNIVGLSPFFPIPTHFSSDDKNFRITPNHWLKLYELVNQVKEQTQELKI